MRKTLHITNGDSSSSLMRDAGISGEILPWRDVLHDGPVPSGLDLRTLSTQRCKFLHELGWTSLERAVQMFDDRDSLIERYSEFEQITLWFEHDLYDQLQILQILDWLDSHCDEGFPISMICTENYLGLCTTEEILNLRSQETPISQDQLTLAKKAWAAYTSTDPLQWYDLLNQNTSALPYLRFSIERVLQEYPSLTNGLSRTERTSLELLSNKPNHPAELFGSQQKTEQQIFMGDSSFWKIIDGLLRADHPLVKLPNEKLEYNPRDKDALLQLTNKGMSVLQGNENWLNCHTIDKWIGGVQLNKDNLWLWDEDSKSIVRA